MSDSPNKNPFSDPNYGSDLTKSSDVTNPFTDPTYGGEKNKGIKGHLQDTATSLMSGAASLPDIAIGIGDIYTEGRVGKAIDDSGIYKTGEGQKYWQDKKTDIAKEQDKTRQSIGERQLNNEDTFLEKSGKILSNIKDKGEYVLTNPSQITNAIGESIAPMVAGSVVGRLSKIANPIVAGSVGEGAVMAGSQAEQIRQQNHDGLLNNGQEGVSAATGILGGLFGFAGGRLAQKMGIADVDTMLVTGRAGPVEIAGEIASMPVQSLPRRVIEGAISEGLLEELPQSISEQVLQNLALDKPWHDGIEDAIVMGTLAGMAMGGASNILSGHNTGTEPQDNQQ